jgi:phenylalanyl-tRNA synthetase alpha chain
MSTEQSETAILKFLSASPETVIEDTYPWSETNHLDHKTVVGAIKSLLADAYVVVENLETSFFALTKDGQSILENGSPEFLVLLALNEAEAGRLSISELQDKVGKDVAKVGMGPCKAAGWCKMDGKDLVPLKKADEVHDEVKGQLQSLKDADFKADALSDAVSQSLKSCTSFPWRSCFSSHYLSIVFPGRQKL